MNLVSVRALVVSASLLTATPGETQEKRAPEPLDDPGSWLNSHDYPARELQHRIEGVVSFALEVAKHGRVTDCSIRQSSGNAALDATACSLMITRARFRPATDEKGEPVAGTWASSIRWEIQEIEPALTPEYSVVLRYVVEKDGGVSMCEVLEDDVHESGKSGCDAFLQERFRPATGADGQPTRTQVLRTAKLESTPLPD